jgi:hypothetical protein
MTNIPKKHPLWRDRSQQLWRAVVTITVPSVVFFLAIVSNLYLSLMKQTQRGLGCTNSTFSSEWPIWVAQMEAGIRPCPQPAKQRDRPSSSKQEYDVAAGEAFSVSLSGQPQAPWAIFYNIYIHPTKDDLTAHGLSIVKEQIAMVRSSYAVRRTPQLAVIPLFYNTIGHATAVNGSFMDRLCHGVDESDRQESRSSPSFLKCVHLRHYDAAFEEVTLQALYEYCLRHKVAAGNGEDGSKPMRVIYLHSKGSFHNRVKNDSWRQALTFAATDKRCLTQNSTVVSEQCSTCGLQFFPVCSQEYPGNMWVASCDYVSKLLPPIDFVERMHEMVFAAERADSSDNVHPFENASEPLEFAGSLFMSKNPPSNERVSIHRQQTARGSTVDNSTSRIRYPLFTSFYSPLDICFGLRRYALEHWYARDKREI